jgi:futalosine hydrolase
MSLLLCAATTFEIQPTLDFIKKQQLDKQITVLFTGVGLLASTYTLTKEICVQRPEMIIQAGIAGSLDAKLALAQVVVVKTEVIGDLGVDEQNSFRDLFSLGFIQKDLPPFQNGKLVNPYLPNNATDLLQVDGVSVNEISTSKSRISYYQQALGAQVESMEGAALHFVALQEKIPFLQLRSISNYIGERDKQAWKLQEAINTLNSKLQELIIKQIGL